MRIDRRLMLIGVMLIVLSMTMATQYAVTKTGYTYGIVHPSNADIRFIGHDNASDNIRVLRINGSNASGGQSLQVYIGNVSVNANKTYTAAFGIVNEEAYAVNITHINVSSDGSGSDYMHVWVHGDPNLTAESDDTSVWLWNQGSSPNSYSSTDCVWQLAAGDSDTGTINGAIASTIWDNQANVQFANYTNAATNTTSDYCWFQISIAPPVGAETAHVYNGQIWIHTKASTQSYGE